MTVKTLQAPAESRCAWAGVLVLFLTAAFLPLGCFLVSRPAAPAMFWFDEFLSRIFLCDPSWAHMFHALGDTINAAPPLYFILGRVWVGAFGASEISLRMYSSAGFALAFVLLADLLRRHYGLIPALLGAIVAFSTCPSVLLHNAEARFYGLFLAEIAGLFWFFGRSTGAEKPSRPLWIAQTLLCTALVFTHYMALPVLAFIAVAYALVQLRAKHFDARPFLCIVLGALPFLFWWPIFVRHQSIPTTWIRVPSPADLAFAMRWVCFYPLVVLLFLLLAQWALRRPTDSAGRRNEPLLILAGVYVLFPVGLWVLSRVYRPLFVERYYFSALLAPAVPIAHFTHGILRDSSRFSAAWLRALAPIFALLIMLFALALFLISCIYNAGSYSGDTVLLLDPVAHDHLPVAFDDGNIFMTSAHYSPEGGRYVLLLDAVDPAQYPIMRGLHDEYPALPIVESLAFLQDHDEFLFFTAADSPWMTRSLLTDPRYSCTPNPWTRGGALFLIRRAGPPAGPLGQRSSTATGIVSARRPPHHRLPALPDSRYANDENTAK